MCDVFPATWEEPSRTVCGHMYQRTSALDIPRRIPLDQCAWHSQFAVTATNPVQSHSDEQRNTRPQVGLGSGVKGRTMIDNISSDDATASFPETDICAVEYSSGDSI